MAPISEAYFPSLEKCFSGDVQLLSWKRAFLYACDPGNYADDANSLHVFLSHPESIRSLTDCLSPFPKPTPKTKSDFDSKTAAIHSETTTQASYDLSEIKGDALWLSQKADIDEISALRIVVLEWQSRPTTRLVTHFSREEITSLEEAAGVDRFRASVVGSAFTELLRQKSNQEDESPDIASEESRRLRIRKIYLSERSHILKTSRKLLSISVGAAESSSVTNPENGKRFHILGFKIFADRSRGDGLSKFLQECVDAVRTRLRHIGGDGGWLGAEESNGEIDDLWRTIVVEEITHVVQILFILLQASPDIPHAELLLSWLQLMAEYNFLESLQVVCEDPIEILMPLQALVCLTTLAFLKLPLSFPAIINRSFAQRGTSAKPPYFFSTQDIGQINEILLGASFDYRTAGPAGFAWGLVLHTIRELAVKDKETRELEQFQSAVDSFQSNARNAKSSHGIEQSLYEELLDCARTPKHSAEDSILLLTADAMKESTFDTITSVATKLDCMSAIDDSATDCQARLVLLDLIRVAVVYLDYSTELVSAVLAIFAGPPATSSLRPHPATPSPLDPRKVFRNDSLLMDNIFRMAQSRFPYETIPFLRLCSALVTDDVTDNDGTLGILEELESLDTFTQAVPTEFHGYETVREDENANFVTLTEPLPMFHRDSRRERSGAGGSNALVVSTSSIVPATALGQVVSESKPAVVLWQHQYSCLSYLGIWLEEWNDCGEQSSVDASDVVAEIVGLFADLIHSTKPRVAEDDSQLAAKRILELASDGLSRSSDIVSVIFDILERNLQNTGSNASAGTSLDSSVACLRFLSNLVTILPSRVWPFLSRSSLLGSGGKGGTMTAIISAVEVPSGDYPFLLTCLELFEAIVDDAASRAVIRRSPNSVSVKSVSTADWSAGVPSRVMKQILHNFVRCMTEIYGGNGIWRFNEAGQRFRLNAKLSYMFATIIGYAYGTNDEAKLDAKITGMFSSSASYLLDVLRPRTVDDLPFNPMFRLISDGLQTPPTPYLRYLKLMELQVNSTVSLASMLVQAAHLSGQPASLLEVQLFKAAPVLVKLYALHDTYRLQVVSLLEILVSTAATDTANEPPSIVGHLGAESSCLFLDVLSQFEKPLSDRPLLLAIWRLLSTFVGKRQQWLAVYILTGSSPRESLKRGGEQKKSSMRGAPFLRIALDALCHIEQLNSQVALSLLEFVAVSQENWPWATPQLRQHSNFFNVIVNYIAKLRIQSLSLVDQIYTTRIAAVVADLCAVYLHFAKEMQDRTFLKTLSPLVSWYAKDAVEVSGYNASLHANLKKNFEMRYTGCKLVDFKRTPLGTRSLGRKYCYDVDLGTKLLSYDFAWFGTRNQGFAEEFERANLNLSLVEAQVTLLQSWKFFANEHCADFIIDRDIQRSMAMVVQNCLVANTRSVPNEAIFERVQQTRVDFAQTLLQRLVEVGARGAEVFGLVGAVWDAMRARRATYEAALANDDVEHYRCLLNVLFLALQFHIDGRTRAAPETLSKKAEVSSDLTVVAEIVNTVVAQGFKTLTTYLHDQPEKCAPRDFAILTAILQTCLQVKNVDRLYEHIVFHIENNEVVRHAVTLFSWADQLLIAGDPVYGDLGISFLVKLSTIPSLAEHIAVESVLPRLSSCRLTDFLRQPRGCSPFDAVPRLHAIWTGGVLPLCLNLLYHVIRTAPEVSAFLNQFEGQLTRSAEPFAGGRTIADAGKSDRRICLSMTSEAYSLALISFILDRFREAGASAGIDPQSIQILKWDRMQVKEDIEELLERRATLRARIVATSEKEVEWARQKPRNPASGAENRLEERIVEELSATLSCLRGGEEA